MRRGHTARLAFGAAAAMTIAKALWLRGRAQALPVLRQGAAPRGEAPIARGCGPAATGAPHLDGSVVTEAAGVGVAGFVVATAAGVDVDPHTVAAAVAHARAHDLDVVELVPGDLPTGVLMALLTQIDPATYRHDRLAVGRGAGHAAVVRRDVLERACGSAEAADDRSGADTPRALDAPQGVPGTSRVGPDLVAAPGGPDEEATPVLQGRSGGGGHTGLDPVAYLELSRCLKRYAPTATDLVVAPGLRAVMPDPAWRVPHLRALTGVAAPALAPLPVAGAALAALAPLLSPAAGAALLAAYLAEPAIVGRGGPVRPRDLHGAGVAGVIGRPRRALADAIRPLVTEPPPAVATHRARLAEDDRRRRATYAVDATRTASFFEPPRTTCPWCGAADLAALVRVGDLFQGKPGTFRLDECRACTHVFQNPRLSLAGLDHYYRDFYDGVQREHTELMFSFAGPSYRGRAAMVRGAAEPKRWLDVGTGHGYFCLAAKEVWPETRFDGLDLTTNVVEAQRRGWVERGFHGLFPQLAADLAGGYDVVSMHHYLEHTRDPAAELDAAATVLEAGGHLLIEVPAPESTLGRRLGWLWGPWLQPQHQHFVPQANLEAALADRGFTVVASERGTVHQPVDLSYAVMLLAQRLAPAGALPWDPPPTTARRVGRAATYGALLPLAGAAMALDHALVPLVRRRPQLANAYRVLARKE
jgi:SAM-dependent methyltransferase